MEPLISVGIPTYNRPHSLKAALNCITSQTYRNLDILISDNASPSGETEQIVRAFMEVDSRIRFFRQGENRGGAFNFDFVEKQATSDYFMWAADDDKWESANLIEVLSRHAPNYTLTFPNCNLSSDNRVFETSHLDAYKDCVTPMEYLLRWCSHGTGYPFYGLYNRKRMKEENISFSFEDDLKYYNEGIFLHRVFLNGRVKFAPNVYITFSTDSHKPDFVNLVADFKKYFARTLLIYGQSKLEETAKEEIYSAVIDNYTRHLLSLQSEASAGTSLLRKTYKKMKPFLRTVGLRT
jgi:glycosyltransferase involved in cell wall biosynthesis